MDEFTRNRFRLDRPAHAPKIEILKKWMGFPEIGLPRKTEISENFLNEFSRIRQ